MALLRNFTIHCVILTLEVTFAQYLGGTINWVKLEGMDVRFTYRMTWQKGSGPCGIGCSNNSVGHNGTLTPSLSSLKWECTSGCGGNLTLHDINYVVTSVSDISYGWEQGEGHFFHKIYNSTPSYIISLDGLQWPGSSGLQGQMVTMVDIRTRNDTNLPNASPIAAVQPFIGIPFGCYSIVSLPVEDPDFDDVRCRIAESSECGGACTNLPHYKIHDENCSISILATAENGYQPGNIYRITVMMEDFPDYNVAIGNDIKNPRHYLSQVPLQLTVNIISTPSGCNRSEEAIFTSPLIPDNIRAPFRGPLRATDPNAQNVRFPYYLRADNLSGVEFLVSTPARTTYEIKTDDNNRRDVRRFYASWFPEEHQKGDAFSCFWLIQSNGITTEDKRCITTYIVDQYDCPANTTCEQNGGKCEDLYHRYTCKCPHGFKPLDCKQRITCADFPCLHGSTCVDTGTQYKCNCLQGYSGVDCEKECIGSSCPPIKKEKKERKSPIWPVPVGIVTAAALTTAAGCCCWWLWGAAAWRNRRKKDKKVNPSLLTPINSRPSSVVATKGSSPVTSNVGSISELKVPGDTIPPHPANTTSEHTSETINF